MRLSHDLLGGTNATFLPPVFAVRLTHRPVRQRVQHGLLLLPVPHASVAAWGPTGDSADQSDKYVPLGGDLSSSPFLP